MPNVKRTPPAKSTNINLARELSHSDSEVSLSPQRNITSRSKRPRVESSSKKSDSKKQESSNNDVSLELIMSTLTAMKTQQEVTFAKIFSEMSDVKEKVLQIQKTNLEIEKSMEYMYNHYEELKLQILDLEKTRDEYSFAINKLEKQLQDIKYSSRSSTVEIRNIPNKENETVEDLINIVSLIGKTIDFKGSTSEIRDIYRLPAKQGTNKTIVAEFSTVHTKTSYLSAARNFNKSRRLEDKLNTQIVGINGDLKPIYVDEYLPGTMKKLFLQSRDFAKKNGFRFCWISNGKILLRKGTECKEIYTVKSEDCLANILKKI
ncbi:hypothetical protein PYW08_008571 [Mythimna loreyi]|uniref:Uncharacterized protein n=1 Tax=Mythimna loreyi TaxID=667449 RepID=A0ACC2Q914_9NEOP|nr:hypothetical protein PYW08_008571 [Mythimna loreyi]